MTVSRTWTLSHGGFRAHHPRAGVAPCALPGVLWRVEEAWSLSLHWSLRHRPWIIERWKKPCISVCVLSVNSMYAPAVWGLLKINPTLFSDAGPLPRWAGRCSWGCGFEWKPGKRKGYLIVFSCLQRCATAYYLTCNVILFSFNVINLRNAVGSPSVALLSSPPKTEGEWGRRKQTKSSTCTKIAQ